MKMPLPGTAVTCGAETEDGCVTEVVEIIGAKALVGGNDPHDGCLTLKVEDIGYFDQGCTTHGFLHRLG